MKSMLCRIIFNVQLIFYRQFPNCYWNHKLAYSGHSLKTKSIYNIINIQSIIGTNFLFLRWIKSELITEQKLDLIKTYFSLFFELLMSLKVVWSSC